MPGKKPQTVQSAASVKLKPKKKIAKKDPNWKKQKRSGNYKGNIHLARLNRKKTVAEAILLAKQPSFSTSTNTTAAQVPDQPAAPNTEVPLKISLVVNIDAVPQENYDANQVKEQMLRRLQEVEGFRPVRITKYRVKLKEDVVLSSQKEQQPDVEFTPQTPEKKITIPAGTQILTPETLKQVSPSKVASLSPFEGRTPSTHSILQVVGGYGSLWALANDAKAAKSAQETEVVTALPADNASFESEVHKKTVPSTSSSAEIKNELYHLTFEASDEHKKQTFRFNIKAIKKIREQSQDGPKRNQALAMAIESKDARNISANKSARETGVFSDKIEWEYLHGICHEISGQLGQDWRNLFVGTKDANTDMRVVVEEKISMIAESYPDDEIVLVVDADILKGTHIASHINYEITTPDFPLHYLFNAQSSVQMHEKVREMVQAWILTLVSLGPKSQAKHKYDAHTVLTQETGEHELLLNKQALLKRRASVLDTEAEAKKENTSEKNTSSISNSNNLANSKASDFDDIPSTPPRKKRTILSRDNKPDAEKPAVARSLKYTK